ncbi:MAG TPA: tripartite tricarboxylate transporter substrate binding protein [Burkholderiaceae bacterium]|nr:tripartite tricarboxylate transporter substrate binding protein [Burkholderiaceae bacterium]
MSRPLSLRLATMLCAIAASATVLAVPGAAHAQEFPSRPIHLIVPFPPGGSADVLGRTIGEALGERLRQRVVVENRPGAGTAIATRYVARAPADGYVLQIGTVSSHAINPGMQDKIGYDPVADFTPISRVASIPFVLLAHPSVPANTLPELIALAKSKPNQLTYASAGAGTSNHLAGEMLNSMAGIKMLHVPYKGSAPALNDLLGGQVNVMFDLQLTALPHIKAGTVRPLALTGAQRSQLLPDLPTVAEAGVKGYEVSAWFGIFGPAGIPKPVAQRLNAEIVAVMADPEVRKRLSAFGAEAESSTIAEFDAFVRSELQKWTKVVKDAGIAGQ